jgi:hypothetical protein
MASPHTSPSVRFVSASGETLDSPPEWTPCQIEIDVPLASWEELELRRNDIVLEHYVTKVDGAARIVATWPRSGAGKYTMALTHPDWPEASTYTCAIRPEKLSDEAYRQLLDDLQRRLPASIAIALQQAGALSGLQLIAPQDTTLAEELNRLRRACSGPPGRAGLIAILRALAQRPHQVLESTDVWTPRDRVRRINVVRLHQAFAKAHNLDENLLPLRVPELRVEHSVDVYENRVVRSFHEQVNLRLRQLRRAAENAKNAAMLASTQALLTDLSRARMEAPFLDEVSDLTEAPTRLTMVLLKRSEYRAALEGFLEFRRSALVQLDEPLLAAPLTELPRLYETWGTLEVIAAFANLAHPLGYVVKRQQLVWQRPNGVWVELLKGGAIAVELEHQNGQVAKLTPQRSYQPHAQGLHSISFAKRPDVAIEITDPDGATAVWIFDPKYKLDSELVGASTGPNDGMPTGAPTTVDIDAMHAYRDAIRDADNAHVVQLAAILYPGPSKFYGEDVAALHADPMTATQTLREPLTQILTNAMNAADTHAVAA